MREELKAYEFGFGFEQNQEIKRVQEGYAPRLREKQEKEEEERKKKRKEWRWRN